MAAAGGAAAGAVTTSAGLGSAAFSVGVSAVFSVVFSVVLGSVAFAGSGSVAVESSLKSLAVGGGTLAGSGRGIAASIASSAALLRAGPACANAEVADTVRKVAATAISTRSNPARLVERSRIVTPLGRNCPGIGTVLDNLGTAVVPYSFAKAPACCSNSHASTSDLFMYACTQRFIRRRMRPADAASATRGNSRQTDFKVPLQRMRLLPRSVPFVCHRQATVQMFRRRR